MKHWVGASYYQPAGAITCRASGYRSAAFTPGWVNPGKVSYHTKLERATVNGEQHKLPPASRLDCMVVWQDQQEVWCHFMRQVWPPSIYQVYLIAAPALPEIQAAAGRVVCASANSMGLLLVPKLHPSQLSC